MTDDIRPRILERLAVEFVDIYINKSPEDAAMYIMTKISKAEHDRMRRLITEEFVRRGYKFPKTNHTETKDKQKS